MLKKKGCRTTRRGQRYARISQILSQAYGMSKFDVAHENVQTLNYFYLHSCCRDFSTKSVMKGLSFKLVFSIVTVTGSARKASRIFTKFPMFFMMCNVTHHLVLPNPINSLPNALDLKSFLGLGFRLFFCGLQPSRHKASDGSFEKGCFSCFLGH